MHQLRKTFNVLLVLLTLTACGAPKTFDVTAATIRVAPKAQPAKVTPRQRLKALTPKQRAAFVAMVRQVALRQYLAAVWSYTHTPYDWYAIAMCETHQDWNVTGARYSTGEGMMNQAIRENSTPDVAARELAGTATVIEIIGTAKRIESWAGIHAWGCGKKLYP